MGDAPPPATDSWSRFLAAQTACMNLALELRPTYGSMVFRYVDLGTIFADAPIEIRARAQEDRLQMLKRLEAQAAEDAVVSESPDVRNPQNKRPMSEPALNSPDVRNPQNKRPMSEPALNSPDAQDHQNKRPMSEPALNSPDAQDPQNKQPMSEPALNSPDAQDPQNKRPMSEPAPHPSAKRRCVSQSALMEEMPNADWVFRIGTAEKRAPNHRHYVQFCLQQIESTRSPRTNKQLAEAYQAASGGEKPQFPHLFERRPDWLITMWSAYNVQVLYASRQMRTLRAGWRAMQPVLEELLAAWL